MRRLSGILLLLFFCISALAILFTAYDKKQVVRMRKTLISDMDLREVPDSAYRGGLEFQWR